MRQAIIVTCFVPLSFHYSFFSAGGYILYKFRYLDAASRRSTSISHVTLSRRQLCRDELVYRLFLGSISIIDYCLIAQLYFD